LNKRTTTKAATMTTWITICDTCKRDDWNAETHSRPHGEDLAEMVEACAQDRDVRTRRVSCLMGCTHGCNVAIQADGKLNYTLGRFEPGEDAAQAIVDYAEMHAASETGRVPFREWPQGVKGHFVTRHPPLPSDNDG
jgi:predicted metal-binding protein